MQLSILYLLAIARLALCISIRGSHRGRSITDLCYLLPLPRIPVSYANWTVPWGQPTIVHPNGTTCCSSLDQVQSGLDGIDAQLLQLLSSRAAYVREGTRFKSSIASVDDPSEDTQVVETATKSAYDVHLPQVMAQMVYQSIINSTVMFEDCIFNTYKFTG